MEGILLINKAVGPSSFDVVHKLRKLAGIKRVGHAGTLDPLASGLLVIAFGRYTKLAAYLTESSKVYEAEFKLGISTTTDDYEGEVIEQNSIEHLSPNDVYAALKQFEGPIKQIPPQFSAIKINGVRAYKIARESIEFSIAPRDIEIFSLEILKIELPIIQVRVHCSKGTYIRSLARDLGKILGCGAIASSIHRTASGTFSVHDALRVEQLDKQLMEEHLLSRREALGTLFSFELSKENFEHAKHGRPFLAPEELKEEIAAALYEGEIIAIVRREHELCTVIRGF